MTAAFAVNAESIRARLAALAPLSLAVTDESYRHRRHPEAGKGGHFRVRIVAARFSGLGRLARHRLILETVGDFAGIHALAIDARAPEDAVASDEAAS